MPKPLPGAKIIANDLPSPTYSSTAFDLPLRKDVIQSDMPTQVTRTVESSSDPRSAPKKPVAKVSGTLYHGTGSLDKKVVHGIEPNFIEMKSKKNSKKGNKKIHNVSDKKAKCRNEDHIMSDTQKLRTEGIKHAKKTFKVSDAVLGAVGHPGPNIILDIKTTNKKEQPDLKIFENNTTRKNRVEGLRRTPTGIKYLHKN